jgi:hypothetical protein
MGLFRIANTVSSALYNVHQTNTQDNPYPSPLWVGDRLDAEVRSDSTGYYQRVFDFFRLPQLSQLATKTDASVGGTLQHGAATGWGLGSGFAPFIGPPLSGDPPGAIRLNAFFAAESEQDCGYGGHLIGFASKVITATDASLQSLPWSTVWKNSTSWSDSEWKLAHGVSQYTLYLQNFTPVLILRADPKNFVPDCNPNDPLNQGRVVGGLTAWYDDGYYYFVTDTLVSTDITRCNTYPTSLALGLVMFRVPVDPSAIAGGGLQQNANHVPQVQLYYADTAGGPKSFHTLPAPDQVLSFSDDIYPVGPTCSTTNRQTFSGCCANPAIPASRALLSYPGDATYVGLPSSNFLGYLGNRYIVLSSNNPQGTYRFRLLKLTKTGTTAPFFDMSHGGEFEAPLPTGYINSPWYYVVLPNAVPLSQTQLIGFRHVVDTVRQCEGQYPFTVNLTLP